VAYRPPVRIVEQRVWVRLTTVPESQAAVERELAQLGVPWTYWLSTQRWPGGERKVLDFELVVPRPEGNARNLVDRLRAAGISVAGWMGDVVMLD
jgi:hypothetical protein